MYRVSEDGSGLQKALPEPVAYFYDVSPDAKSLAVLMGKDGVQIVPVNGGRPAPVCTICGAAGGENRAITPPVVSWSADGKFFYLNLRAAGQIYAVPIQPGRNGSWGDRDRTCSSSFKGSRAGQLHHPG